MKKRIFGMLLMGAMVVASMSMFTSCKDYDDDINKNASDIQTLQTQLSTLQTALTSAQSAAATAQSTADAAVAAAKAAQNSADANATAIKAIEAQVAAAAKASELEAVKKELEKAIADATADKVTSEQLVEALKPISAKIDAIDESLNSLTTDVASLKTWKESVDGQIASVQADLKSQAEAIKALQDEIQKKLNKGELEGIVNDLAVKAYVEEQLKPYAKTADVTELLKSYTTTAKLNEILAGYSTPASVNAAIIEALKSYYTAAKIDEMVGALTSAIETAQETANAAQTAEQVKAIAQAIADKVSDEAGEKINTLNVLVNKMLTSVTLVPQLYINGIEAIQFRSIKYIPQTFGPNLTPKTLQWNKNATAAEALTFKAYEDNAVAGDKLAMADKGMEYKVAGTMPAWADWTPNGIYDHQLVNVAGAKAVTIDNGETEAYYRLSPAGVKEDEINTKGLEYACTTATTETRAPGININNPVKPTFAKLENGIMTVKLSKTVTNSLAYDGSVLDAKLGSVKGNIVSLKVPRLANEATGQEAADIYSEFNLLDEVTITPRIAALNKQANGTYVFDGKTADTKHDGAIAMQYHFIDSTHIYQSMVDKDLYVKEVVSYKESFDLRKVVTGCYETAAGVHTEITKDELEAYGIKFFFAIPTTVYNTTDNAFNKTNQQVFATLAEDGYTISSKLPSETTGTGSMSVNGKEPIIRVMMVDTKNGNLIDQAYFKIKWADTTPDKEPFKVTESAEQVLSCNGNKMEVNWQKFIEDVYAKLSGSYGDNGLDWDKFRVVYPQTQVYYSEVKAANIFIESGDKTHIDYNATGLTTPNGKIRINWLNTETAPEADANHLTWELDAADIKTIPLDTRKKTMTAKVIFKSAQPKDYGNIEMTLNFTIKLPEKPSIVGYNDNQWFVQKEKFYVYPVQYNTLLDGSNWTTEVKYDFNVMQQFTVTTETDAAKLKAAGTYTNWIIKGVPMDCGTWDLQFAKTQNNSAYAPTYITAPADKEPLLTEGVAFASFDAYELDKAGKLALNLKWMKDGDAHMSWQNKEAKPFARLTGYKANKDEIIPLMNDLAVENEADGWTPKKTNDDNKSVTMKVWAKYNAYNVEEITSFKAYLVTPIRIDHKINGAFEDLHISGTVVDAGGKLGITDFAGYAVAKAASGKTGERYKYEVALWNYYGVQDPVFDTNNIIFGVKMDGGNLVVDNSVAVNATGSAVTGGMKMADVATNTAGAFNWSVTVTSGKLTFKNQTGRALDKPFNVFVPVTVKHHFGEAKMFVRIPVYPKGQAIADGYTVIDAI
jgi:hypothetical protein